MTIAALDLSIIVFYILGILAIGIWTTRSQKLTSSTYFLAGRSLGWPLIGAALFASNISTIHVVGLAASGYNEGLVWGNFEWLAIATLVILALVFAPFYFRNKIETLPEYLERRYSPASRSFLAFLAIISALTIHIGISLYAGAEVFETFFGIDKTASIVIISIVTGIYTILGGLKAVVITETIQTVILIAGTVLVTVLAWLALGEQGITSLADLRAATKPEQLTMVHSESTVGLNWYAVLLGYPVLGIWYWCTDQTIVQRVLAAKSERDAQLGPLFAGVLKILPVFVMVLPGVFGYVLYHEEIGNQANQVLPVMIQRLVPTGFQGLVSAALLAALMSTIAAALNSCGTLFAVDIVKRFKPDLEDRTEVRIGQWSAVVIMVLAMLWSTQGDKFSSIFDAAQKVSTAVAPPIAAVFAWGVFWRRGTKQGALACLIFGFAVGLTAFLVDVPLVNGHPVLASFPLISEGLGMTFMIQTFTNFCLSGLVLVVVSLMTPPPRPEQIDGLTWRRPLAFLEGEFQGIADPRLLAVGLGLALVAMYSVFG